MQKFLLIFLLTLLQFKALSQEISGTVLGVNEPIMGATVQLKGRNDGTSTDLNGNFILHDVPAGDHILEIRSVGFKVLQKEVTIPLAQKLMIHLEESTLSMDEVVITGTMQPTFISASPVKVEVVSSKFINTFSPSAATSLIEGVALINGVQEVTSCGVCFTNSISINGLPGPYTAVLMDGSPIYGNLASVYGLNGMPSMIIDRIEVIKGPNSTLYGSEAVAGVINVITKSPEDQPILEVDIMGTSHLESFGNLSLSTKIGKSYGMVGINHAHMGNYDDANNDSFGDRIHMDRISLFSKWKVHRSSGLKFSIAGKYHYEDRRNGVKEFLTNNNYRTLRGSHEVYGESIYTNRFELFGTYEFLDHLKADFSLSSHEQNSFYGDIFYKAKQNILFTNMIWNNHLKSHDVTLGLTNRIQYYDDNTIATLSHADQQHIPGIFGQDEWKLSHRLTSLTGIRLDHYKAHGLILSPRQSFKYQPGAWTTFRTNFGTGFRIVNLFTEDHAFVTGQREVVITEDLKPEESINFSININHVYTVGSSQGMLDVDAFYTYFTNKITPNYEDQRIVYENIEGFAISKGFGINLQLEFSSPLAINLGLNLQEVTETEEGVRRIIEYAPRWTGLITANYQLKKWKASFAYSTNMTGPMGLPTVYDVNTEGIPVTTPRPTTSETFTIHNIHITKNLDNWKSIYFGIQNLFNYVQPWSPMVGFNDPNAYPGFSDHFDTAYAYSPIHGREVYLGLKWVLE